MVVQAVAGTLLERDTERDTLLAAWSAARRAAGSTWFICAEGGGGKSRFLREVAALAPAATVCWGAAEPVAPPEPYLALTRALPAFEPGPNHSASAMRVLEALESAAAGGSLLLILDDLHYADEGTSALLFRLASEAQSRPWLIACAFRPGEGVPALTNAAVELVAQGKASRLDLAPLSPAGILALVEDIRGEPVSAEDAASIAFDSGGNPWFVEALARGSGAMSAARDRIQVRLGRLEREIPGSFRVLSSMVAITRPVPFEIVAQLSGGDSPELRALLRDLRAARVLEETEEGQEGWHFRQELMRRAVLESMIAADRRDAHRALAEALEPGGHAPELAMHYAAAGDGRAAMWALRAARDAAALDGHSEALGQLKRALSCDLDPARRQEALSFAAYESLITFQPLEAIRMATEGLQLPDGHPGVRAHLHIAIAAAAWELGKPRECWSHLEAAVGETGPEITTRAAASTAVQELMIAASDSDGERLGSALRRARASEPGSVSRAEFHAALQASADVYEGLGRLDAGVADPSPARDAVWRLEAIGASAPNMASPVQVVAQLIYSYRKAVTCGYPAFSAQLFEDLEPLIEVQAAAWTGRTAPYRTLELAQSGEFAGARTLIANTPAPNPGSDAEAVVLLSAVRRECRAGSLARAARLLGDPSAPEAFIGRAATALAQLEFAVASQSPEAVQRAQALYDLACSRHHARFAGEAAIALARLGEKAPAMPDWLDPEGPLTVWWEWAAALTPQRRADLAAVSDRLGELGWPYEAATARADAGDTAEAYRAFRELGAVASREQAAAQLRGMRQPVPRRTRSAVASDGLTDAEREICRLVASGVGNIEIARQLTVSVRTVETHLTNIYRKAGRKGRVALTNWWRARTEELVEA